MIKNKIKYSAAGIRWNAREVSSFVTINNLGTAMMRKRGI